MLRFPDGAPPTPFAMTETNPPEFSAIAATCKQLGEELTKLLPSLVASRRNYMRSRSEADKAENLRLEQMASELGERHSALYEELKRASGLLQDVLDAIDRPRLPRDEDNRRPRESLVRERVDITGIVDDHIAGAIEVVSR
jgi:hypothetical protein